MPILPINYSKIIITNQENTRGIIVEYPKDMGNGEILDRINEIRQSLIKSIDDEIKANVEKEEKKEEPSLEVIK